MPLYRIEAGRVLPVARTTFSNLGMREREDLQALLRSHVDVIAPGTLVVAEEFCEWEDSRRRIDLLGVDRAANLVVIELKRTEDGGHMDLQAVRYAAMVSTLTFDKLVTIFARHQVVNGVDGSAEAALLDFLGWAEPDEDRFGQEVKIVLASAEFSKELTTSVMWLNEFGLDIRCVRLQPYQHEGQVLLDVQTVIPIPEAADYQVRIRDKKQAERESRQVARDLTKYDVTIGSIRFPSQNKRRMMFHVVAGIMKDGGTPEQISRAIPWRRSGMFEVFDATLTGAEVRESLARDDPGGAIPRTKRYFCEDDEVFRVGGKAYVLSNQWGERTLEAVDLLAKRFPDLGIRVEPTRSAE